MKRMLWSLGLSLATTISAQGQDVKPQSPASLGIPKASLGLPQPVGSGSPMILPSQYSQPFLPVGAVPTGAPAPIFPSPYRLADGPKQMPKAEAAEDGRGDPKIGISSPGSVPPSGPSMVPGNAITSGPFAPYMGPQSGLECGDLCQIPGAADPFIQRDRVRLSAEYLAWSAVHGMALLVIDGPLRDMSRAQTEVVGQRLLDMVEKGIS